MSRISCDECRERLGEVLHAEVLLEESPSAVSSSVAADVAELREHVASCAQCRSDLQLLRAARRELSDFHAVVAPYNLTSRIRAELEREPNVRAFTQTQSAKGRVVNSEMAVLPRQTVPAEKMEMAPRSVKAMAHRPAPRDVHDMWDRFAAFFNRPSNVAWASGAALAVFCMILVARPDRQSTFMDQQRSSSATREVEIKRVPAAPPAQKPQVVKVPAASGAAKDAAASPAPLPTAIAPFSGAAPGDFTFPQENPSFQMPGAESGGAPMSGNTPAPARSAASPSPAAKLPPATTTRAMPSPLTVPANSNAMSQNGARRDKISADGSGGSGRNASFAGPEGPAGATASAAGMAAPPSPAADAHVFSVQKSARREDLDEGSSMARASASASPASAPAVAAARMNDRTRAATRVPALEAVPPASKFVSTRIRAPRDISWGQVSVTLNGGARFSDGGRTRVFWRGSAGAGDSIDVSFSVTAPRGEYSANLRLQQVKGGDAQTVASDSVSINLR
jgi:hypothetical protein